MFWLKENWFRLSVLLIFFLFASSIYYYLIVYQPSLKIAALEQQCGTHADDFYKNYMKEHQNSDPITWEIAGFEHVLNKKDYKCYLYYIQASYTRNPDQNPQSTIGVEYDSDIIVDTAGNFLAHCDTPHNNLGDVGRMTCYVKGEEVDVQKFNNYKKSLGFVF